ncbi:ABC transporter ATP-binding protein [Candidatus Raskinella chloraquaticus]|uniref:Peptide ABC transporter substrate-binding protein n=1 Tax=Candidatus Raskinella chloraquaticus TaxID=1951219 RepID=A0A1W9HQ89_9HYPH|nr:MAG: peptide ABC transporter substrate-binding protein [Proteobacteria bacterium SG_bin8]
MTPVLLVQNLKKYFPVGGGFPGIRKRVVYAVDDVTFSIARGETLSLVGESGCGKSTVGKAILKLFPLTGGDVILNGERFDTLEGRALQEKRRFIQVVFQDPFSSLNPRMKVGDIIAEPLRNFKLAEDRQTLDKRLAEIIAKVGLPRDAAGRFPHEFSGGQRQRIGIARALAASPDLIICDEAVSALDVSVKAQIVNLLQDLQRELGLTLLFISHDLAIVEHMTHHVAVMYLGRIVEMGPREALFAAPRHPYTQALLSAVPSLDPDKRDGRIILSGDVPSPMSPPSGCRFHTRCPQAFARCRVEEPATRQVGPDHVAACHLNDQAPQPTGGAT